MDLLGRRGDVVLEPPDEHAHAGAGDEAHGAAGFGPVQIRVRELGPEVGPDQVVDALLEDADDELVVALASTLASLKG
ncbi:MAG TPA: hypothetical protein VFB94_19340 [Acidimicrobiales bacterium]|nr:hypothetical protein [Acidimicrobiales bacterium]